MNHIAVNKFVEYLRIETVQPFPDYKTCTAFLKAYGEELGLASRVIEFVAGKPVVILTLVGSDPALKSLILNSHTDVVPVSEGMWSHPPFGAEIVDEKVYARGSQDMKCVGIWYLEAIRQLKEEKRLPLKRTLHLTFVPDEEIGGKDGMEKFIESEDFKLLNPGFALDEGLANEEDAFKVYWGERSPWWIWLKSKGSAGHGSKFIEPSATVQLLKVLNHFMNFRDEEANRMKNGITIDGKPFTLGDVTTTNITMLKAGVQMNVVGELAEAGVDMRVSPTADFLKLENDIKSWVESQPGVEYSFIQHFGRAPPTILDDNNKQWQILKKVAKKHQIDLDPEIFPAATDSRFLRMAGIPAFGISAIKNTPVLLHDHNEYLSIRTLLDGIGFYGDFIFELANLD